MKKYFFILCLLLLNSCTSCIIQKDTEGKTADIVDTNRDAKGDVKLETPSAL